MNLIIWLVIGGVLGWLASIVMKRDAQQGVVLNIVVGIVGALIASWVFPALGMGSGEGSSFIGQILYSTIGAVILLVLLRLVSRAT